MAAKGQWSGNCDGTGDNLNGIDAGASIKFGRTDYEESPERPVKTVKFPPPAMRPLFEVKRRW